MSALAIGAVMLVAAVLLDAHAARSHRRAVKLLDAAIAAREEALVDMDEALAARTQALEARSEIVTMFDTHERLLADGRARLQEWTA